MVHENRFSRKYHRESRESSELHKKRKVRVSPTKVYVFSKIYCTKITVGGRSMTRGKSVTCVKIKTPRKSITCGKSITYSSREKYNVYVAGSITFSPFFYLYSLSSCACPVLPFLFYPSVMPVLFYLSNSACPLLPVLFCLSCSTCPVLPVLFLLFFFGCRLLSVLPGCLIIAVMRWQGCPGSPVLEVMS
jgi:hypothetical protein